MGNTGHTHTTPSIALAPGRDVVWRNESRGNHKIWLVI